jgi:hypothetical protein
VEAEDHFSELAVEKAKSLSVEMWKGKSDTEYEKRMETQRATVIERFDRRREDLTKKKNNAETELTAEHSQLKVCEGTA